MAYRFSRNDRSVEKAVRRIAREQIDGAIAAIERVARADAVHNIRRRFKKLRALVRLVRPGFARFAEENADFRDSARLIARARDAKVMLDTHDVLLKRYRDEVDCCAVDPIRRLLAEEAASETAGELDEALDKVRERLLGARLRTREWRLRKEGWEALEKGLARSYGRACKAASLAHGQPDDENFHELRKWIKHHWHHCRLLAGVWPGLMGPRIGTARTLSDLLGFHHDFAVYAGKLSADISAYGSPDLVERAIGLAERRQREIEDQAWPAIERLLAQRPNELASYWGRLWTIWRDAGERRDLPSMS
jgi:hypothetical protein